MLSGGYYNGRGTSPPMSGSLGRVQRAGSSGSSDKSSSGRGNRAVSKKELFSAINQAHMSKNDSASSKARSRVKINATGVCSYVPRPDNATPSESGCSSVSSKGSGRRKLVPVASLGHLTHSATTSRSAAQGSCPFSNGTVTPPASMPDTPASVGSGGCPFTSAQTKTAGNRPAIPGKVKLDQLLHLIGEQKMEEIAHKHYQRVFADKDNAWFANMFKDRSSLGGATLMLKLFFGQQMGGGADYGGFKLEVDEVKRIHEDFVVGPKSLDVWMKHMKNTLDDDIEFPDNVNASEIRKSMLTYFESFGRSLVNASAEREQHYIFEQSHRQSDTIRSSQAYPIKNPKGPMQNPSTSFYDALVPQPLYRITTPPPCEPQSRYPKSNLRAPATFATSWDTSSERSGSVRGGSKGALSFFKNAQAGSDKNRDALVNLMLLWALVALALTVMA